MKGYGEVCICTVMGSEGAGVEKSHGPKSVHRYIVTAKKSLSLSAAFPATSPGPRTIKIATLGVPDEVEEHGEECKRIRSVAFLERTDSTLVLQSSRSGLHVHLQANSVQAAFSSATAVY